MSLASQVQSLATRIGTEFNTIRSTIGSLASLTTTNKTSIVNAVNEVNARPSGISRNEAVAYSIVLGG